MGHGNLPWPIDVKNSAKKRKNYGKMRPGVFDVAAS